MAGNVGYTPGTGAKVATREVSYSGKTAQIQTPWGWPGGKV
jgi:hypothetical protein